MVPLAEFIKLPEDEREGCFPYLWSVDRNQHLTRLLVAEPIVRSCEERRDFWIMLRAIARVVDSQPTSTEIEANVRRELTGRITANLMQLVGGGEAAATDTLIHTGAPAAETEAGADNRDYVAPWIETEDCTSCDECIQINSNIFEYNADKKALIKDGSNGPYKDIVKAAERCTARVIHPGLPRDRNQKGVEKLIARGEKFN